MTQSEYIKNLRKQYKLTQTDLANILGITTRQIARYEDNKPALSRTMEFALAHLDRLYKWSKAERTKANV